MVSGLESELAFGFGLTSDVVAASRLECTSPPGVSVLGVVRMVLGGVPELELVLEVSSVPFIVISVTEDGGFWVLFGEGLDTSGLGNWVDGGIWILVPFVSIRAFFAGGSNAEVSLLSSSDVRFRPEVVVSVGVVVDSTTSVTGGSEVAIVRLRKRVEAESDI